MSLLLSLCADPVCLRPAAPLAKHEEGGAALAPGAAVFGSGDQMSRSSTRRLARSSDGDQGIILASPNTHTQPTHPERDIFPLNVLNI